MSERLLDSSAKRNVAVICNPLIKTTTRKLTDTITRTLKKNQIRHAVFFDSWPQVWDEFSDVWIIGGDGTLNYFINHNPEIQIPLSVFRGGTGNDFHWVLYGNITVEKQIEKVINGKPDFIDAGICNNKLFLNGLGVGFDGAIVQDLEAKRTSGKKKLYYLTVLKNIFIYNSFKCDIISRENRYSERCFMVSVANGKRYGGGFIVTPKAILNDGLLDVSMVGSIAPLKRLRYLPAIIKGLHTHLPFIKYYHTNRVVISSLYNLPAHLDGEPFSSNRFEIGILPKRFTFMR